MPKKARPSPLAESIFREKLAELQSSNQATDVSELPVHNTFIQFGGPPAVEGAKQRLSTAPAWIGTTSFQSTVAAAMQAATQTPPTSEAPAQPSLPGTADSEGSLSSALWLVSPMKVPVALCSDENGDASPESVQKPEEVILKDAVVQETPLVRHAPRGPLALPGEMPSRGSATHNDGLCKRCCFFPKGRCTNGFDCEFCHLEHDKRKRKKKKKSKSKTQDSEDSDDSDDEQENKAPDMPEKAVEECTVAAATAPCAAEVVAAAGLPPGMQATVAQPAPPLLPAAAEAAQAAAAAAALSTTYDSFMGSPYDYAACATMAAAAAPPLAPVPPPLAPAPLADASARVPASPVQQRYMDSMYGYGVASPASPGFGAGMYCPGNPLVPTAPPMVPAPSPATLPASLQGANAVQAGATVQNASVLPGTGLPPPR